MREINVLMSVLLFVVSLACVMSSRAASISMTDSVTIVDGKATPGALTQRDVMWSFFSLVESRKRTGVDAGAKHLAQLLQVDQATSAKLVSYIDATFAQYRQYSATQLQTFCSTTTATDAVSSIAAKLSAGESATDSWRAQKVQGLTAVLDDESLAKVFQWADANVRANVKVYKTDYAKLLSQEDFNKDLLTQRMAHVCKRIPTVVH